MQPRRGSWDASSSTRDDSGSPEGRQRLSGGTTAALRRDDSGSPERRQLAEALDGSEDAWSGAGVNGPARPTSRRPAGSPGTRPGAAVVSGVAGAQRDGVGELVEDGEQLGDLLVGVGGGELQAEADLVAGHTGVEGEGGVDAVVQ